uniref:Uncharacterized protein n=2 Tax=Tetranychus urticae TaxID=32264 RepID=T1L4S1_TETUR
MAMQRIKETLRKTSSRDSLDSSSSLDSRDQQVPGSPKVDYHRLLASTSPSPSKSPSRSASPASPTPLPSTSTSNAPYTFALVNISSLANKSEDSLDSPRKQRKFRNEEASTTPESEDTLTLTQNSPTSSSFTLTSSSFLQTQPSQLLPTCPSKSNRSRSFDSAAASVGASSTTSSDSPKSTRTHLRTSPPFLELPKWKMLVRNKNTSSRSTDLTPHERDCVHCVLVVEQKKDAFLAPVVSPSSSSLLAPSFPGFFAASGSPSNYSPPLSSSPSISSESSLVEDSDSESISTRVGSLGQSESMEDEVYTDSLDSSSLPTVTLSLAPEIQITQIEEDSGLTVISLEVPVLPKSGRSASVDSSYLKVPQRTDIGIGESPPVKAQRSRSVDVALPVGPDGPYIIVPTEKPQPILTQ